MNTLRWEHLQVIFNVFFWRICKKPLSRKMKHKHISSLIQFWQYQQKGEKSGIGKFPFIQSCVHSIICIIFSKLSDISFTARNFVWLLNAFSVGNLMFSIIDLDTYSDLNDLRNSTVETLLAWGLWLKTYSSQKRMKMR